MMIDKPAKDIDALEEQFPPASGIAFSDARDRATAAGYNIVVSENGARYDLSPDGRHRWLKQIEPPVDVTPGQKIELP